MVEGLSMTTARSRIGRQYPSDANLGLESTNG
jgi:hypothetical protein